MDQNRKNLLEDAQAVDATARGGTTSKPTGRAHGMARGLTLLTMRVDGEFRLGVKTQKGILDATKCRVSAFAFITNVGRFGHYTQNPCSGHFE